MKKVTVVLPTYNEKDNLEKFVGQILSQEKNMPGWRVEVVISDSFSIDGTAELAKKLALKDNRIHLIQVERGIGVGLIKGHQFALEKLKPNALAQMDADGQVGAEFLPKLVKAIEDGYDLVLGSRLVEGGENQLSFRRKFFTTASSWFCRIVMGPFDIKEFTNSARAFTPELFKKINLNRLPWKEKTFINQPAFLNEAVLSGAKYIEVPLVFKDREEGYSKNKTFNYSYDIVTYAIDARLHKWDINIPFFRLTRRAKTFIKFGMVGFTGTMLDFAIYNLMISKFGFFPATAKGISTEFAIINNFLLNNAWTFRHRKTDKSIIKRFIIFNMVSFGGLTIGVLVVKLLYTIHGEGFAYIFGLSVPFYNIYFFAAIPPIMLWNFTVNHFITWRQSED